MLLGRSIKWLPIFLRKIDPPYSSLVDSSDGVHFSLRVFLRVVSYYSITATV
jgi:hypothetical protein